MKSLQIWYIFLIIDMVLNQLHLPYNHSSLWKGILLILNIFPEEICTISLEEHLQFDSETLKMWICYMLASETEHISLIYLDVATVLAKGRSWCSSSFSSNYEWTVPSGWMEPLSNGKTLSNILLYGS
jgi:hypothetical protein